MKTIVVLAFFTVRMAALRSHTDDIQFGSAQLILGSVTISSGSAVHHSAIMKCILYTALTQNSLAMHVVSPIHQTSPTLLLCNRGLIWHQWWQPFTKPPLFRKNRLTRSGNPTLESKEDGKALLREIEVYSRSSFQIPHDCT